MGQTAVTAGHRTTARDVARATTYGGRRRTDATPVVDDTDGHADGPAAEPTRWRYASAVQAARAVHVAGNRRLGVQPS